MIVEEILPLNYPACERRVRDEDRATEIALRNSLALLRWFTHPSVYGEVVGKVLFNEHMRRIR